jgi:hypothetical protein
MSDVAVETAYYFNEMLLAVALIAKGVRFPAGKWMRVVTGQVPRQSVEQLLANVFPYLKGKVLTFVTLTSESDVQAFEASIAQP